MTMIAPGQPETSQQVYIDGRPYELVTAEQAAEIARITRAWDVRRVPDQRADPSEPFEYAFGFEDGYGFSFANIPSVYDEADGWAFARGKVATWPRHATAEAMEDVGVDRRGWIIQHGGYVYAIRGSVAVKYLANDVLGDEWPALEYHYLGSGIRIAGRPWSWGGALYVPLINSSGVLQRFHQLTTVGTPVTEVQVLTTTGSPTGGTWILGWDGGAGSFSLTGLAFDITADALQTQLRTIPGFGKVTVARSGTTNLIWTVTMTGAPSAMATASPAQFTVDDGGLTGGASPEITPTTSVAGTGDLWTQGPANILARCFIGWGDYLRIGVTNTVRSNSNGGAPMTENNWNSGYVVGDAGQPITDLAVFDNELVVGKTDGPWVFDENAVAHHALEAVRQVTDAGNCVGMTVFNSWLLIPHKTGLIRWRRGSWRYVGGQAEGALEGELSHGWGRVTGLAAFGKTAYGVIENALHTAHGHAGAVVSLTEGGSRAGGYTPHMHHQIDGAGVEAAAVVQLTAIPSGATAPSEWSSDADVGAIEWTNPENAGVFNESKATAAVGTSELLKGLDINSSIPSTATINGIVARIRRAKTAADDDTGAKAPGTAANAAYGANAWTNPSNALTANDSYATCATGGISQYLKLTNLAFALPTTATVLGVEVSVHRKRSSGTPAITRRSTAIAQYTTLTQEVEISKPTGTIAGDTMIAIISGTAFNGSNAITPPSGWTTLRVETQGALLTGVYAKRAGISEGSTYTFEFFDGDESSSNRIAGGAILTYTGCKVASVGFSGSAGTRGVGTNVTHPTLTPPSVNSVRLAIGGLAVDADVTAPSGYTMVHELRTEGALGDPGAGIENTAYVAERIATSATATGALTSTTDIGSAAGWNGFHVILEAAAGTHDEVVSLLDAAGAAQGTNKATATAWPTTEAAAVYGGAADLWGATLTPAIVNDADWGVAIAAYVNSGETASIDAVTITVHYEDAQVVDNVVRLLKADTLVGDNKADAATEWPSEQGYATYGGSADLWGTSWTPAQINAADFGIGLSATVTAGLAEVDHVELTVHYTLAGIGDPASFLMTLRLGTDREEATPYAYKLDRADLGVANDPDVDKRGADLELRTSRVSSPDFSVQKTYNLVDFRAEVDPEIDTTPGFQLWASVDDGDEFQLLDAAGAAATVRASGVYRLYFPRTAVAVGSYVQLRLKVPALGTGESPVRVGIRDLKLHGFYDPRSVEEGTAVFLLRHGSLMQTGQVSGYSIPEQVEHLESLTGRVPMIVPFTDPDGAEGFLKITRAEFRDHRFKGMQHADKVAVLGIRVADYGS